MYNFDMMSFSFHQPPSTQSPTSQQSPSHHRGAPTPVSSTHTTAQIHALLSHSLEHEHGQVKQTLHIGRSNRFTIYKVLIESLFGYVCLGVDHHTQQYVCIKVSNKQLCSQNQSVRGDNVVDNVNREAAIMAYLQQKPSCTLPSPSSTASVSESHLPAAKCISRNNSTASGISLCHETDTDEQDESERDGLDLASDLSRLSTSASSMSDCLAAASSSAHSHHHSSSSRSIASPCCTPRQHNVAHKQCVYHQSYQHHSSPHSYLDDGSQYLIKLISEFEDGDLHCLVSEYASGSDLFDVILKHGPLDNELAKHLFRQICTSVKYMHDRHIAHLDISLENVCLTADGEARIIDMGSACIHPLDTNGQYLQQYGYSIQPAQMQHHADPSVPLNDLKVFPCIPARRRPGKKAYMSPELYSFNSSTSSGWLGSANKYFDAYMCDTWSLGVILYTLLSGHPPFTLPHPDDSWFRFIYTSRWLHPESRLKKNSSIYRHIDEDALQLINAILKPQHQRLTIDQILQSPWLNQSNKYSSNKRAASQSDSMPSKHHHQPQHQYAQHQAMSQ